MEIPRKHVLFVIAGYSPSTMEGFFNYGICQLNQAGALASIGYQVSVVARFGEDAELNRNGVRYVFINDGKRPVLKRWEYSKKLLNKIEQMQADVVHFHGFIFPVLLSKLLSRLGNDIKLVAEYHSDPIFKFMKSNQKKSLQQVDRLIFANEQASAMWTNEFGFPADHSRICIECAPSLKFMPRSEARSISGFKGGPVFLWNSRLIKRRDPMTVIEGYEQFLSKTEFSQSHFYWMVPDSEAELLKQLKEKVSASPVLKSAVTIIKERKPHNELAPYFSSADYILTGTMEDGYGYGVADAMSCGVVPIVSNISTFKQITDNGKYGTLWEPGNPNSLAEKMTELVEDTYQNIDVVSNEIVTHFRNKLSQEHQARQLEKIYEELTERKIG